MFTPPPRRSDAIRRELLRIAHERTVSGSPLPSYAGFAALLGIPKPAVQYHLLSCRALGYLIRGSGSLLITDAGISHLEAGRSDGGE